MRRVGDIHDPIEAGRAGEDLVVREQERRVRCRVGHERRRVRGAERSAVVRRHVVIAADLLQVLRVACVEKEDPRVAPRDPETVAVLVHLMALDDLVRAVGVLQVVADVAFAFELALDVEDRGLRRIRRVGVVDHGERLRGADRLLRLRRRGAAVHVAVVDLEPMRRRAGGDELAELRRLRGVLHVVEDPATLHRLAGGDLYRVRRVRVVPDDEDHLLRVEPQIRGPRAGVVRDEREHLHVRGVADVGDDHAEHRRRVAREIGDALVHAWRVDAGAERAGREMRPLEVAVAEDIEVLDL